MSAAHARDAGRRGRAQTFLTVLCGFLAMMAAGFATELSDTTRRVRAAVAW